MSITHAPQPAAVRGTPELAPPLDSTVPERPVFAARSQKRPLWLARISRAVAVLVGLWVLALIAGALGLGRLPGVPDLRPSQLTARPNAGHTSKLPAPAHGQAANASTPPVVTSDRQRVAADARRARARSTSGPGGQASKSPAASHSTGPSSTRRTSKTAPGRPAATTSPAASPPAVAHGNANGNGNGTPAPTKTTAPGRSGTAHGGGNSVGKGTGTSATGTSTTGHGHGYGRTKAPATTP